MHAESKASRCIHPCLAGLREFVKKDCRHTDGSIGLLTGPHQTSLSDVPSLTILLSDGDRPVFAPEYADKAPEAVMAEPVS